MKAVASTSAAPIADASSLTDVTLPDPAGPQGRDLLVRIKAVSVNPVDTKVRKRAPGTAEAPKVLGYDAAGVVEAVGPEAALFKVGDAVFYAGDISRPGTNSELHLVDERIVGPKPKCLDFAEAAALPLTAITAWEMLFDRFRIAPGGGGGGESILIMAGAGGVGSIATQLARRLTGLTVVATASRPETRAFATRMGAHHVIDHTKPLAEGFRALGIAAPRYIFSTTGTDPNFDAYVELIAPQGLIGVIDDPQEVDVRKLKPKAAGFVWEFMFTRPVQKTPDMIEQHRLLSEVSRLVDEGVLATTLTERVEGITAANLRAAHGKLEGGSMIGKVVLEGF